MTKELCHGLQPSRAKGCYDPGISPDPTGNRLRLGPVRNATQNPPAGEGVNRRCDRSGTVPEQCCKGRGRIKACGTAAGHRQRASRGYGSGSVGPVSVYRGTGAGGGRMSNDISCTGESLTSCACCMAKSHLGPSLVAKHAGSQPRNISRLLRYDEVA